jgi:hypothetical protein
MILERSVTISYSVSNEMLERDTGVGLTRKSGRVTKRRAWSMHDGLFSYRTHFLISDQHCIISVGNAR